MKPLLLDLFCGAGGAARGYHDAGFEVVGVDIELHPDFPYEFHTADALTFPLEGFDAYHASPPCQAYSSMHVLSDNTHPELVEPVRERLRATGKPYVIENVVGAPLFRPLMLCGTEFGLSARCHDGVVRQLQRHRLFESNVFLWGAGGCAHTNEQAVGVYGTGGGGQMTRGYKATRPEAVEAMGIDWMRHEDIVQAIPPAYTRFIGEQLMAAVLERAA